MSQMVKNQGQTEFMTYKIIKGRGFFGSALFISFISAF